MDWFSDPLVDEHVLAQFSGILLLPKKKKEALTRY